MKKMTLFLSLLFIILTAPQLASGATLKGDEAIAGWHYYLEKCRANEVEDLPEFYVAIVEYAREYLAYEYEVSEEEYEILCRIVEAEATGGNIEQKKNVCSCVLARVESGKWASTIKGVVFQNDGKTWQFSPISDGRYYTVKITEETRQAVDEILRYGKTHDCHWFCSDGSYNKKDKNGKYISYHRNHHTHAFFDGEHHYFYN